MFKRLIAVTVVCIATVLALLAPAASADPRRDHHHGRFIVICFVDRNRDRFDNGFNRFDNGFNRFDNGFNRFDNGFNGFDRGDLVCFVVRRHHHHHDRFF